MYFIIIIIYYTIYSYLLISQQFTIIKLFKLIFIELVVLN